MSDVGSSQELSNTGFELPSNPDFACIYIFLMVPPGRHVRLTSLFQADFRIEAAAPN